MAITYKNRWQTIDGAGEGGQAHVFRVRDLTGDPGGVFALKRLKNVNRLPRFQQEIAVTQKLDHPSIAKVIDYALDDPAFFVTEYVSDRTLEHIAPTSPLDALRLFEHICEAVQYAHDNGVTHRDLKPDNILLRPDNSPVIIDFGLCYVEDQAHRPTATMEQVGSRFYMAPEMERGHQVSVTTATDIYSLGKILYFLLTGRNMAREFFVGADDVATLRNDPQLKYVTDRIFAKAIVPDVSLRPDVKELIKSVKVVMSLISEHFYPGVVGSKCRFCGEGAYSPVDAIANIDTKSSAYISKHEDFYIVSCNSCGNIQWFNRRPK